MKIDRSWTEQMYRRRNDHQGYQGISILPEFGVGRHSTIDRQQGQSKPQPDSKHKTAMAVDFWKTWWLGSYWSESLEGRDIPMSSRPVTAVRFVSASQSFGEKNFPGEAASRLSHRDAQS
jgi:hypothetical protein